MKRVGLAALVVALLMSPAWAADVYWTGSAGDGLWATGSNWSTSAAPGTTDNVILVDPAAANYAISNASLRTIADLSFNSNLAGHSLVLSGTGVITLNNISVAANLGTQTVSAPIVTAGNSSTVNVGAGSTLDTGGALSTSYVHAPVTSTVTKSGDGIWNLSGGNVYNSSGSAYNQFGNLLVTAGTVKQNLVNADMLVFGGISVSQGASLDSTGADIRLIATGSSWGNSTIQDMVVVRSLWNYSPGTITLSGKGMLIMGDGIGAGNNSDAKQVNGFYVIDDRTTNIADRIVNSHNYGWMTPTTLVGNDSAPSQQIFRYNASSYTQTQMDARQYNFVIQHGSADGAHAVMGYLADMLNNNTGRGIMMVYAKDAAGNFEELGTPTQLAASATTPRSFFNFSYAKAFIGNANQKIMPYGFAGAYTAADGTNVGSEFLTQSGTYAYRYSGAGRLELNDNTTATTNAMVSSGTTLGAGKTVNSLRITGDSLNLGGNTLVLANTAAGSGLIATGTNSSVTISNGTISAGGTANGMYVVNDVDLSISAGITAQSLSKSGTGKLTVSGALSMAAGNIFRLYDGAFEYNTAADAQLAGLVNTVYAQIIKRGNGTLDAQLLNYGTAGAMVYAGTLKANPIGITSGAGSALGAGTTEVFSGGRLYVAAGQLFGPITAHNGGVIEFGGGTTEVGAPITLEGSSTLMMGKVSLSGAINAGGTSYIDGETGVATGNYTKSFGAITMSDTATGRMKLSYQRYAGPITMRDSASLAFVPNSGGTNNQYFVSANLSNYSLLSAAGKVLFSGTLSLTDNARYDQSAGQSSYQGVTLGLASSATLGGFIYGPALLTDNARLSMLGSVDGAFDGGLTLRGTSSLVYAGKLNYQQTSYVKPLTAYDYSTVTMTGTNGGWCMNNNADSITGNGHSNLNMVVWGDGGNPANGTITGNDNSTVVVNVGNGSKFTGTVSSNGSSNVVVYGSNGITGPMFANDTSTLTVNTPQGTITVAPGATLNLGGGTVAIDINNLLDTRTVNFGGGYGKNGVTLASTLNVSGSRTVNLLDWHDSTLRPWAGVYLDNVVGSGTITRNGGTNVTLDLGAMAGSSWTGDIVNNTGVLMFAGTTAQNLPAGLGSIVLGGANSTLFAASATVDGNVVNLIGHTVAGIGNIVADDHADIFPGFGQSKLVAAGATINPINGAINMKGDLEFAMNGSTAAQVVISSASGSSYGSLNVSSGTGGHGHLTGLSNATLAFDFKQTGPSDWAAFQGATMTVVSSSDSSKLMFSATSWTNNMRGQTTYGPGTITVSNVHNTVIPGDGNGDMKVDVADYTLYFNNYGNHNDPLSGYNDAAWCPGDMNGDGNVDVADYTLYFNNYGDHTGGGSAVPEPATMALLALGGLAILRRRR